MEITVPLVVGAWQGFLSRRRAEWNLVCRRYRRRSWHVSARDGGREAAA